MTDSSASKHPSHGPEMAAGEPSTELRLALATELNKVLDGALMKYHAALTEIADPSGRWSHVPIDSEAANAWARMVDEMQRIARTALE